MTPRERPPVGLPSTSLDSIRPSLAPYWSSQGRSPPRSPNSISLCQISSDLASPLPLPFSLALSSALSLSPDGFSNLASSVLFSDFPSSGCCCAFGSGLLSDCSGFSAEPAGSAAARGDAGSPAASAIVSAAPSLRREERVATAAAVRAIRALTRAAAGLRVDTHMPGAVLIEVHLPPHRSRRLAFEPQPVEETLFLRLVPIDEAGARVQDLVIVDERGLTRPQHDFEANLLALGHLLETGERFFFEAGQRLAHALPHLFDGRPHKTAAEHAVLCREHRHPIGGDRLVLGRLLAAA